MSIGTNTHHNHHHKRFTTLFSGTTWVSWCQKKDSSGHYGAREDNKRQTHRQSGWAPLHLDQSAIPPFLRQMPFLLQLSQFILAWDRHRNMLYCIPPVANKYILILLLHQKGKPFWILLEQEMMGWQWHQLDHKQIICTSLQTDNHAST